MGVILVTGATGLLGSFVVKELLRRGHRVRGLARRVPPTPPASGEHLELVTADLSDPTPLSEVTHDARAIVHLASSASSDPDDVLGMDVASTARLLADWRGGPVVFLSSAEVYGPPQYTPMDEQHPREPDGWRGMGKLFSELTLETAHRRGWSGDVTILRAAPVFAPHPRFHRSDWGRVLKRLLDGEEVAFPESAEEKHMRSGISWVHVGDLARAVAVALERSAGGAFNIASGYASYRELLDTLAFAAGGRGRVAYAAGAVPALALPEDRREISTERAYARLGFVPQHSLIETARAVVESGLRPDGAESTG